MKPSTKNITRVKDDSLFGLLSPYKSSYTFVRVLVSPVDDCIIVQLTDNPKNFHAVPQEKFGNFRILRRLEIGVLRLSLKYVVPENLIRVLGPMLVFNILPDRVVITDSLAKDGIYSIETSLKYKQKMIQGVKKLLNMSPHKRYEIVEKYLSEHREKHHD